MQILSLVLTIIGAILALFGGLIGSVVLGIVGTLLAIIGALCQYVTGRPFIRNFSENDWQKSDSDYFLSTPASRHLRGHGASAKIYQSINSSYEVVECDEAEEKDGSFTIRATMPFRGRLVLK